ncbi:DUF4276 family protein [Deinococcus sp. UYEF24]
MGKVAVIRVNVVVEGQTEEDFVNRLLAPHLGTLGIYLSARRVETSRQGATFFRGGVTSFGRAHRDIRTWLSQERGAYVTTFFDLYGLPKDFPGYAASATASTGADRAALLEQSLANSIDSERFIPYIQPYEFEALLYSDLATLDDALQLLSPVSQLMALKAMMAAVSSPEDLNDSPNTAPSKRLLRLYPSYDKRVFGSLVTEATGLPIIRHACPHFHSWLARLEQLT